MKTFAQINSSTTHEINLVVASMDLVDQIRAGVATTQGILDGLSHCKDAMTKEDYKGALMRTTRVATIMGLITPEQFDDLVGSFECPTFDQHWSDIQDKIAESGIGLYSAVLESNKMLKEALLSL